MAVQPSGDKASGPTACAETLDSLEFLAARVVSHIPDKGQVLQRSYGCYANRTRGTRPRAARCLAANSARRLRETQARTGA